MLWNQQHEEAYEEAYEGANRKAGARFARCPTCGCRVCDDCFYAGSLPQEKGATNPQH
jgi:hypothetical protein